MRNILITTKALVSIPDDAIINENGTITLNDGKVIKNIAVCVSLYDDKDDIEFLDMDILNSDVTFEDDWNNSCDEGIQTMF